MEGILILEPLHTTSVFEDVQDNMVSTVGLLIRFPDLCEKRVGTPLNIVSTFNIHHELVMRRDERIHLLPVQ